jgi:hypothetical protein
LEAEMTSDIGVEPVVEQQLLFHCSCGGTVEARERKGTCLNCGETIQVIRGIPTPHGRKYTLRVRKRRHSRDTELRFWQPVCATSTHPTQHHLQSPDYDDRYFHLGLLLLLAPLYLPLLLAFFSFVSASLTVEQGRSNARIIEMAKPTDCGWFTDCHYEKRISHDRRSGYTIVRWERVND